VRSHDQKNVSSPGLGYPRALCLTTALTVAQIEEYLFVRNHPQGAPFTPRQTVNIHHFGYDAERGVLWGGD
jgi:hypothetical protein